MQKLLSVRNICKIYKGPEPLEVLKGIEFSVSRGETIAIMGRSGSGKSTLLQILGSLESPTSGEIELCNQVFCSTNLCTLRNQHIGFVFQSFHLFEDNTVLENILMPAKIARKNTNFGSPSYQRALDLLKSVDLFSKKDILAKYLSGGEKQRTAIARALCNDPDLLIADEPTGNLDSANAKLIHELLFTFVKAYNKSLVLATHDKELAMFCDKIFLLKDGLLYPINTESINH